MINTEMADLSFSLCYISCNSIRYIDWLMLVCSLDHWQIACCDTKLIFSEELRLWWIFIVNDKSNFHQLFGMKAVIIVKRFKGVLWHHYMKYNTIITVHITTHTVLWKHSTRCHVLLKYDFGDQKSLPRSIFLGSYLDTKSLNIS